MTDDSLTPEQLRNIDPAFVGKATLTTKARLALAEAVCKALMLYRAEVKADTDMQLATWGAMAAKHDAWSAAWKAAVYEALDSIED